MTRKTNYMVDEQLNNHEPVGSTGGGRHAPAMQPDRSPSVASHWCDEIDSRVYCDKAQCPYCAVEDGENE